MRYADLSRISAVTERPGKQTMTEIQMMNRVKRLLIIPDARCVMPGFVSQDRRAPWFIQGYPHADRIPESLVNGGAVFSQVIRGIPVVPSALLLQHLGKIPVV